MAHELDMTTGRAGIAYVGNKPWHGYGQELTGNEDLDQWRIAAGLDWEAVERPVFYGVPSGQFGETNAQYVDIPERKALVRSDTQQLLSVVSDRYQPVQPKQVIEFYRDLIETNGFKMHTAGSLKDGKRIWALAEIGESTRLFGQDQIDGYVLLATSYDASMATTARLTTVRVVCNNTLQAAYGDNRAAISIPHNTAFNEAAVKGELGLTKDSWEAFTEQAARLAETRVSKQQVVEYFVELLGIDRDMTAEEFQGRKGSQMRTLLSVYNNAPGQRLRSAEGTAWGLVNAVTYYQDHLARASNQGARCDSAWFGAGAQRKAKALDMALELVA